MSSPFYSSYWNPHQSKSTSRSNYSPYSSSSVPLKRKSENPSPKVVSIPVHFVESEQKRSESERKRSDSALKIQKVLRGFLVRKSIHKIVSIQNQVRETEMKLCSKQGVELIAKDPKERLKVNETLMSLLFKLDSVRGIDSGVRDLRRGVIKKAIALQERVDALPHQHSTTANSHSSSADVTADDDGELVAAAEEEEENKNNFNCNDEMLIDPKQTEAADECLEGNEEEEGNCVVKEVVEDCNALNCFQVADDDEKTVKEKEEEEEEESNCEMDETVEGGEIRKKDEDMKMMMRMMSELIEKNELQTRMINSLTHRVGQLEKAFLCDRLRRSNNKKKKQQQQQDGKQHPSS